MEAYEEMLSATSKEQAPWFVLPADDKWFTRLCLAAIISREFDKLDPTYPIVSDAEKAQLQVMREKLLQESNGA